MWRPLDQRIDPDHLPGIRPRPGHCCANRHGRPAPPPPESGWLRVDIDATVSHRPFRRRGEFGCDLEEDLGFHPPSTLLGSARHRRREGPGRAAASREIPAAIPPPITSPSSARHWRRCRRRIRPDLCDPSDRRSSCAAIRPGAARAFADACRAAGVGFSFGFTVDDRVRNAAEFVNEKRRGRPRSMPTARSATGPGSRRPLTWCRSTRGRTAPGWLLRKERPHPGAQLRFTDSDGAGSPR